MPTAQTNGKSDRSVKDSRLQIADCSFADLLIADWRAGQRMYIELRPRESAKEMMPAKDSRWSCGESVDCTMGQNQAILTYLIIHLPTSLGVRERMLQASKRKSAEERMSSAEQANECTLWVNFIAIYPMCVQGLSQDRRLELRRGRWLVRRFDEA